MSIKVFHTMSALESTILVHVNNLPYTQDGVVICITIDMFQFTDVTASHVYVVPAKEVPFWG